MKGVISNCSIRLSCPSISPPYSQDSLEYVPRSPTSSWPRLVRVKEENADYGESYAQKVRTPPPPPPPATWPQDRAKDMWAGYHRRRWGGKSSYLFGSGI